MPVIANVNISVSAVRSYITNLRTELAPKGVRVAHRSLGVCIDEPGSGGEADPDAIADMWYRVCAEKKDDEDACPRRATPASLRFLGAADASSLQPVLSMGRIDQHLFLEASV